MQKIETIRPDIFVIRLGDDLPEIKSDKAFTCFFMVNYLNDKEYIRHLAKILLLAGCKEFVFYGAEESVWHLTTDEADIELFPDAEDVACTYGIESIFEFVGLLQMDVSLVGCKKADSYLFYDDEDVCREVIEKLNDPNREE